MGVLQVRGEMLVVVAAFVRFVKDRDGIFGIVVELVGIAGAEHLRMAEVLAHLFGALAQQNGVTPFLQSVLGDIHREDHRRAFLGDRSAAVALLVIVILEIFASAKLQKIPHMQIFVGFF